VALPAEAAFRARPERCGMMHCLQTPQKSKIQPGMKATPQTGITAPKNRKPPANNANKLTQK